MKDKIILLTPEELKEIIKELLIEHDKLISEKESETKLFSIIKFQKFCD